MNFIQIEQRDYYLDRINSELESIYYELSRNHSTIVTTSIMSTGMPTTSLLTTSVPTTAIATTSTMTTSIITTSILTTGIPTTTIPTTAIPTTALPTTGIATTGSNPFSPLVPFDYFTGSNMTYCSANYMESQNCTVIAACNYMATTIVNFYSTINGALIRSVSDRNASTYFSISSSGYTYLPDFLANWTVIVFSPSSSIPVIVPVTVPLGFPSNPITQVKVSPDGQLWITNGIGTSCYIVIFNISGISITYDRLYYKSNTSSFNPVDIQFDSVYVYIADQGDSAIMRSISLSPIPIWTSWTGAFMGLNILSIYQTNFVTDTSGFLLLYTAFLTAVNQNIGLFSNNTGGFTFSSDGILYIQDISSPTGFRRYRGSNFYGSLCTPFSTTGINPTTFNPTTGVATTGVMCSTGLTYCPGGGCVSTSSNPNFCGSCGYSCSVNLTNVMSAACTFGQCTNLNCTSPYGHCSSNISTGCETNLNNTITNCGSCVVNCNLLPGVNISTVACKNFNCTYSCATPGYINCGLPQLGCNVDKLNDNANCNGCGNICGVGTTCVNGSCVTKKKREENFYYNPL